MIFIYRRDASDSARDLAAALGENATRYRGLRTPIERKARAGDTIIAWGEHVPPIQGVTILNGGPIQNKFNDAIRLREAGVATVEVSRTRPAPTRTGPPPVDPARALWETAQEQAEEFLNLFETTPEQLRTRPIMDGVAALTASLTYLREGLLRPAPAAPLVVEGEWLPRRNNHVGGNDLLTLTTNPDYFSKKEDLVDEFRIHSFKGRSIRAGRKVQREDGFNGTHHAWIRSWDGGWRIVYDGVRGAQPARDLAHAAVAALGLDFGAVDIGVTRDGRMIVLEVNRAPGLAEGTAARYAEAITVTLAGAWDAPPVRRERPAGRRRAA